MTESGGRALREVDFMRVATARINCLELRGAL